MLLLYHSPQSRTTTIERVAISFCIKIQSTSTCNHLENAERSRTKIAFIPHHPMCHHQSRCPSQPRAATSPISISCNTPKCLLHSCKIEAPPSTLSHANIDNFKSLHNPHGRSPNQIQQPVSWVWQLLLVICNCTKIFIDFAKSLHRFIYYLLTCCFIS